MGRDDTAGAASRARGVSRSGAAPCRRSARCRLAAVPVVSARVARTPVVLVLVALCSLLVGCSAQGFQTSVAGSSSSPAGPAGSSSAGRATSPATTSASATGSTSGGGPASASGTVDPAAPDVHTFVAVGDSLTAGTAAVTGGDEPSVGSWVQSASVAPLQFTGAWAVPGWTTADMLRGMMALQADSLVVLGGTNDIVHGVDPAVTLANLVAISDRVTSNDVLLVAVPPLDSHPAQSVQLDQQLQQLADQQGWLYVDPWEGFEVDGSYVPGASSDGVHPMPDVATLVGSRIRTTLLYGDGG